MPSAQVNQARKEFELFLRISSCSEHIFLSFMFLPRTHTSIYLLKDSAPEQFAVVAFDEHIQHVTSAMYLEEPSLRVALSMRMPANEVERRIQVARQNPVW